MKQRNSLLLKFSAIFIFLICAAHGLKAQEKNNLSYIIKDKGSVLDVQPYINAMANSDFRNHRLKNKRYTITFQTGLTIELFSATEMLANGLAVNPAEYPESFDSSRQEPVFALAPNNFIIEYHTSAAKHN
jgi:hypothetical protein